MTELVSIYVPTRNRRHLLERAVTSVLAQSYPAIEVVVVNDASSDDTRAYLDDLTAREPRVIALHMETAGGAPAARNRAIARASGFYVTGLDDDDEFHADRVATFVRHWDSLGGKIAEIACLFSESLMVDGTSAIVTTDRSAVVAYQDLFRHNAIGNQIFCPKHRVTDIGGFDEAMPAWQDLELFMRLLKRFGTAHRVDAPTYICHVDGDHERISGNSQKLRTAFERIAAKHNDVPTALHHQLFLQLFSPFYGFVPTAEDWQRMLGWRAHPKLFGRLLRAHARNRIVQFRLQRAMTGQRRAAS